MQSSDEDRLRTIFPNCCRILGNETWGGILVSLDTNVEPHLFSEKLDSIKNVLDLPIFIIDLARIEWAIHTTEQISSPIQQDVEILTVNPSLTLLPVSHQNLVSLIEKQNSETKNEIIECDGTHIIIWKDPQTSHITFRETDDADLLALKIAVENIDTRDVVSTGGVKIGTINSVLRRAVLQGILLSPKSRIRRNYSPSQDDTPNLEEFLSADIFTLQWHLTQACDLHCKHCYDRTDRDPLPYHKALSILNDFNGFCDAMHVNGQVTFTGGNPVLYPHFKEIYKDASEYGFEIAILGNPSPMHQIEKLLKIQKPAFFQISLEGLEAHNDMIRGKGHFERSLNFLEQLRDRDIYTMVMLTLSRDNLNQVLPLAHLLRDRTESFTFNRLSTIGEGAHLQMANPDEFQRFLDEYETETHHNPVLRLKDNLFNINRSQKKEKLFGGCTGYGCGAAFNFVSLLADGEVHACRKFPSPIGNIWHDRLANIYHSDMAKKYRNGSTQCKKCSLNIVCRGCLAIAYSHNLDVFQENDPFCFMPL